jgi:hypothetical protein
MIEIIGVDKNDKDSVRREDKRQRKRNYLHSDSEEDIKERGITRWSVFPSASGSLSPVRGSTSHAVYICSHYAPFDLLSRRQRLRKQQINNYLHRGTTF